MTAALSLAAPPCAAQAVPAGPPPQTAPPAQPGQPRQPGQPAQNDQPPNALLQELNKYPGLLPEFGQLFTKLQHNVQLPPARVESRLLPLLPEATMSYAAFPNYGDAVNQTLKIFQQELQESAVLRDWWQHGSPAATGPKFEEALDKLYQLSQYVGDEIVVSGSLENHNPSLLVVAEIRKPGLKAFLQQLNDLAGKSTKTGLRILDPQELAAAAESSSKEPLVLVRPDFVVASLDVATLRSFNALLDRPSGQFASTAFGQRIVKGYQASQGGVTILAAADVRALLAQVPNGFLQNTTFQRTGFADVKYWVWAHRSIAGKTINESELSFTGPRRGAAAWLAPPGPLGSLDFVSPKAIVVASVLLKDPPQILEDVKAFAGPSNSTFTTITGFEQMTKLSVEEDLLRPLGGELTLEADSILPAPVWQATLRVTDAQHLLQTLNTLLSIGNMTPKQVEDDGVTYYTLHVPSSPPYDIGYAFVDGYWVVASSHERVVEAVRLHKTSESLGKSTKFLAALPPGRSSDVSGLFYQDPVAVLSLGLQKTAPDLVAAVTQLAGETTPSLVCAYGEETAIREASSSSTFDAGAVLAIAAIAIPNLLRSRMAANEASAISSIRTVNVAQVTYQATYPKRGFAPDLATLGPDSAGKPDSAGHANLIDSTLGAASCTAGTWCTKSGYTFRIAAVCRLQLCKEYVLVATPAEVGTTGVRRFCSTSDGVIHFNTDGTLTWPVSAAECRKWTPVE